MFLEGGWNLPEEFFVVFYVVRKTTDLIFFGEEKSSTRISDIYSSYTYIDDFVSGDGQRNGKGGWLKKEGIFC